jgi:hypothetical protein
MQRFDPPGMYRPPSYQPQDRPLRRHVAPWWLAVTMTLIGAAIYAVYRSVQWLVSQ